MATTKNKSTTTKKNSKSKKTSTKAKTTKSITTKKVTTKKQATKKTSKSKKTAVKSVIKRYGSSKTVKPFTMMQKLNAWNWLAATLNTASGVAIIMLSENVSRTVTTNFLTEDLIASTGSDVVMSQATRTLFELNISYVIAAMFFVAAAANVLVATTYRKKFESDIKTGVSLLRWLEYGVGTGLLMVLIGLMTGISDLTTLTLVFGSMLTAGLLGYSMELHKRETKKVSWLLYGVSALSVIIAAFAIKANLTGAYRYGDGSLPAEHYWLAGTVAAYLLVQAMVVMKHYVKKKNIFSDYLVTDTTSLILSFAVKSAVAWQVYIAFLK